MIFAFLRIFSTVAYFKQIFSLSLFNRAQSYFDRLDFNSYVYKSKGVITVGRFFNLKVVGSRNISNASIHNLCINESPNTLKLLLITDKTE